MLFSPQNIFKRVVQGIILYIHVMTRTPAILGFYFVMFFGIFGSKSVICTLCFYVFLITVVLNIILVLSFNVPSIEKRAVALVGLDFANKYLSHSAAAAKSLGRLLAPTTCALVYDGVTGKQRDDSFKEGVGKMREDMVSQYQAGQKKMGDETARAVMALQKDYVYGGNITQSVRYVAEVGIKEAAIEGVVAVGDAYAGIKKR